MHTSNERLNKRWRVLLALFFAFILLTILQDVIREIVVYNVEANMIEEELIRDIYIETEANVSHSSEAFLSRISQLEELLVIHANENIAPVHFALEAYLENNPSMTESEMLDLTKNIVHQYNLADETHDYYLYDIFGNQHYNGLTKSFVSIDLYDSVDALNRPYIEDFTAIFDEQTSGQITVYDSINNELAKSYLYGESIEGTDFIVANKINVEQFSLKEKDYMINDLRNRYSNQGTNIFVVSTEGEVLYHQNETLIGEKVNETDISILQVTLENILAFTNENEEGHTQYDYYLNFEDGEIGTRVAYLYRMDDWDIILGSSVDLNEYNYVINSYLLDNLRVVIFIKIPALIILSIISFILYLYLRSTITLAQVVLQEEEMLYRKFANNSSEIIMITDLAGRILYTNRTGTEAIFGKRENKGDIYFDQIFVEEEGYYILYGYVKDYYVKFRMEKIDYNQQESILYLISDETDKIETERKLQKLSQVDDLTGLPNRRQLGKEYNDVFLQHIKKGKIAHLAMIDLDNFKPTNDQYGHSYGDKVLKQVASIFIQNRDKNMYIYRVGGDEFTFVFLNISREQVDSKLKDIRKQIEEFTFDKSLNLSFSVGITEMELHSKQNRFSDFYDKADQKLYQAKKIKKNNE
jgi:diguanylate cyclase (GGDEF)-like protein